MAWEATGNLQSKPRTTVLGPPLSCLRLLNPAVLLSAPHHVHHGSSLWHSHLRSEAEHTPSTAAPGPRKLFYVHYENGSPSCCHMRSRSNRMMDRKFPLSHKGARNNCSLRSPYPSVDLASFMLSLEVRVRREPQTCHSCVGWGQRGAELP